ncbi:MAG: sodium:solute symporter family protein [Planctomycetales bacterium]|nr:sodium:solute symporter family protein [Planctomycetales bacterium]
MSPDLIPLWIIAGYLLLLLCLGGVASRLFRGTSQDYMLASHSIGPFLLLMSVFGTTMTAFALVGSTGEAYREGIGVYGMLASSSGIVHSLCFFVIGIKLWSFGKRYGYRTQIQYFSDRLESRHIGLVLFPILVGLVIPYLLIGVISSGAVINGVTRGSFPVAFEQYNGGVPNWLASLVICVVVLIYVFFGGMRGTAWANTFQTIVFMLLGLVTFYVIAGKLGGQESFLANLRTASEAVSDAKLTRENIPPLKFATYMFVPLSVAMFPHLFQHWLTARSAESFKLPVVAHPIFIMIVWLPCVLVGVWATTELANIPPTVKPNVVLAFMVNKMAGKVLGGFLTAGVLAAIMSSLDSQFLCVGSMFTNDVVLRYAGHDRFTDKQVIMIARLFVVAVVALTFLLSLPEQPRVFTLGVWCFSGFSSLFPLVFAALYWRRLTAAGAYASVIAAITCWCWLFYQSDFAMNTEYTFAGMMPVATMLACSTVALVVVSLVTQPPSRATIEKFFPEQS